MTVRGFSSERLPLLLGKTRKEVNEIERAFRVTAHPLPARAAEKPA
jgi:hypothetical protein